jgi:hypothetical protein
MPIEIKEQPNKIHGVFVRLDDPTYQKVLMLVKRHKVERTTVIRRLIEEGLKVAI